jgi:pimeloyl-ACP methyl ester carboxylesterase
MIEFTNSHTPREVVEKVLPTLTGETTRQQRLGLVEEIMRIGSAQPRETVVAALQALRDRPDARPWLESISLPTLVIVGSEDTLTPPDVAQSLANHIADARLQIIEAAGHLSNLENPNAFNTAVSSFLSHLP